MGSQKDGSEGGDPEDLPSDFFDDFNKDEFMQGLSVIDSWDDEDTGKRRIDAEAVGNVKDLRELIEGKDEERYSKGRGDDGNSDSSNYWNKGRKRDTPGDQQRSSSRSKLDDYIKPGSRRDPSKTNEAIKRDKEVKVKELLAKHLDDDLRPPGTELDDYYSENKPEERKGTSVSKEELPPKERRSREYQRPNKELSPRHKRSPHRSPRRSPRREFVRRSPHRNFQPYRQFSPQRKFRRYSPQRRSPRRSPHRRSPLRRSPRRSPMRRSPRRYSPPRRLRRSRSPLPFRDRRSPSPFHRDTFLYPNDPSGYPPAETSYSKGPYTGVNEYPGGPPGYAYPQNSSYAEGYAPPGYEYGGQPQIPLIPLPQPVPAPTQIALPSGAPGAIPPTLVPLMDVNLSTPIVNPPSMVPPPSQMISPSPSGSNATFSDNSRPFDALAQVITF